MSALLATLKPGERATVLGYSDPTTGYARHLLSLGLIPGTEISVTRYAPLGDPVEIEFRGTRLALRPSEAAVLKLQRQ